MNGRAPPIRFGTIAAGVGLLLLIAWPAAAWGADAYVDDDTGSGGTCSIGQPCATIQLGIGAAGTGDTVFVDGGMYADNAALGSDKSLAHQEFIAADGDSVAMIDGGVSTALTVLSGDSAGTIDGFTIRSTAAALVLEGPATVRDNMFDDPAGNTGLSLLDGSGGSTVSGNTFIDTPADTDGQFGLSTITSGSPTIAGNTFENLQTAMHIANGNPTVSGNTITGARFGAANVGVGLQAIEGSPRIVGNDIHSPNPGDNAVGIAVAEAPGPPAAGATLRRNEVYDHTTGVRTNDTEGAVTLNGDVIAGSSGNGIAAVDTVAGGDEGDVVATNVTAFDSATDVALVEAHIDLDSSIVGNAINDFANGTCTIAFSRGPAMTPGGTGCDDFQTTAAPQFVNPGANNYHLKAGSPMIDAGNPANPGFVQDLDGGPRAVDGDCNGSARRDIGADERAVTCPGPPPATDDDPPETEITTAPKRRTRKRKASFEFSADEPASFECKLDKREFAPCSSPFKEKVKRRRHAFEVQATDDAGNADPTPATHEWKVKRRKRR